MTSMKVVYDDDEIEILYERSPGPITCGICSEDLTKLSLPRRQAHCDAHISGESEASTTTHSITRSKPVSSSSSKGKERAKPDPQNIFWHPLVARSPPESFSPGLIPVLKKALIKSHGRGQTQRAWLCHEQAVHIVSETFDRQWGCGYRNFLMACAALMVQSEQPMYFPLLDAPTPPGVRNLQDWIEEAWEHGYDKEGAEDLRHRLSGTQKWIGTAELNVAFTYRGIPSQLADFEINGNVDILLHWVLKYFSAGHELPKDATVDQALRVARPVVMTGKMPLILQHAGHSRTIVGCEKLKDGTINLLVFDPSRRVLSHIRDAGLAVHGFSNCDSPTPVFSPVKFLHQVASSMKRKAVNSSVDSSTKRARASTDKSHNKAEPIVIDSDDDIQVVEPKRTDGESELDYSSVIGAFRLSAKKLGKKDKYQILSFPLDPPWEEAERRRRREVMSVKIK